MSELQQQLGRVERRARLYESLAREVIDFLGRVEIPDHVDAELVEWKIALTQIGLSTKQTKFHRSAWTPDPANTRVEENESFDGLPGQVPIMSNGQKVSEATFGEQENG